MSTAAEQMISKPGEGSIFERLLSRLPGATPESRIDPDGIRRWHCDCPNADHDGDQVSASVWQRGDGQIEFECDASCGVEELREWWGRPSGRLENGEPMREEAEQPAEPERVEGLRETTRPTVPPLTDSGNAERFAAEHGKNVRHCRPLKKWIAYDGKRWAWDDNGEVERRAKETVREMYRAAAEIENKEVRAATVAWARKSEAAARREALLQLRSEEHNV